ncbi:MAG: class I SAM-dependent methyltransferase, partial [Smithella sp.]
MLHSGAFYPAGSHVLEAGCGVGAQTVTLAKNSPDALITSVDISETSLAEARKKVAAAGLTNVFFEQAD